MSSALLSQMHLRMARAALGWSYAEFSRLTGIAKNSLVRFEAGQGIHLSTARRIEEALSKAGITLVHEDAVHGPGIILAKDFARLPSEEKPVRRPDHKAKKESKRVQD